MGYPDNIVIGIDGATFDLIKPWCDNGELSNFKQFMQTGTVSELTTTYPPLTAPAWVSFMTGCNPGRHGVFDFLTADPEAEDIVNYNSIKAPTLWEMLSQRNEQIGLVNVSVTYPPPEVNGHVISGSLSSTDPRESCHPPDLIETLEQKTGESWWQRSTADFTPSRPLEYFENHFQYNQTVADYALRMLEDYNYDFFMVLLDLVDSISHFFWHYMDEEHPFYEPAGDEYQEAILRAYKFIDRFLGSLDTKIPDSTNVILMSDHGFGPIEKMVNINNFFLEEGLLKLKQSPGALVKRLVRNLGITPTRLVRLAEKVGLDSLAFKLPKSLRNKIIGTMGDYSDICWPETTCYSRGHMGQIHVADHLKSDSQEYRRVRDKVARILREKLRDPETGEQLVTDIFFREDIYEGPYLEEAPDMFLVMQDYRCIAYPLFSGGSSLVIPHIQEGRYANHRMNGIFCGRGPAFREAKSLESASIVDLAPTILYLQDLPIAEQMDGSLLRDALIPELLQDKPPEFTAYSSEDKPGQTGEDEEIKERLQNLGYLG